MCVVGCRITLVRCAESRPQTSLHSMNVLNGTILSSFFKTIWRKPLHCSWNATTNDFNCRRGSGGALSFLPHLGELRGKLTSFFVVREIHPRTAPTAKADRVARCTFVFENLLVCMVSRTASCCWPLAGLNVEGDRPSNWFGKALQITGSSTTLDKWIHAVGRRANHEFR